MRKLMNGTLIGRIGWILIGYLMENWFLRGKNNFCMRNMASCTGKMA
jgi:hypothetical protein